MGIKNILKKIRIRPDSVEPIFDSNIYDSGVIGYAGGSLQDQNILVVTNVPIEDSILEKTICGEMCHVKVLLLQNKKLMWKQIIKCGEDLLGPFTHIVNVVYANDHDKAEPQKLVYQWMQIQMDYCVKCEQYATVCTVLIAEKDSTEKVRAKLFSVENMIRGLGLAMANHDIIVNGIFVDSDVGLTYILKAASYMSSKYGQIMSGEILEMSSNDF